MSIWQRMTERIGTHRLLRGLGFYPPFLGAGVRVTRADAGLRHVEVEMRLAAWNQNYVGTQFGGSLYSMCDPFFMIMLMENLGRDYVVWDKSARIEFKKPGRGRVRARFVLEEARIEEIRAAVARDGKARPVFEVEVRDDSDALIAQVTKELSVRKKR